MTRFFDLLFCVFGLLLLSPLLLLIALAVRLDSPGPALFRQERIGRGGAPFTLYKFRSMGVGAHKQGLLTVGGRDPRITRVGAWLRRYKLDELPQLWNVLRGDMSLVGPRPEVRRYVDLYTPEQRVVLRVRPGVTDYASINYRHENELLAQSADPERTYLEEILPEKIRLNRRYLDHPGIVPYFRILFSTIYHIFR